MDDSSTFYVDTKQNNELESSAFDQHSTLAGELVTSTCERVFLYTSFSDNRQGLVGTLFCTNYRLCFIASDTDEACCSRSLFARNNHDIPLMCIERIYYAGVSNDGNRKLRLMCGPLSGCDAVSSMKIHTNDYRTFQFGLAASQFSVQLLNLTYHFAFPAKPATVFRTQFPPRKGQNSNMNVMNGSFNERVDWERELHRTGAAMRGWRLAQFNVFADRNVHKTHVRTYPNSVVVPLSVSDTELQSLCACYQQQRLPIWVWSMANGSCLLRSGETNVNMDNSLLIQSTNQYTTAIAQTHPSKRTPFEINVSDSISSLNKLTACYDAFRKLCTINSPLHFEDIDNQWPTSLEAAGWLSYVSQCMKVSGKAVRRMLEHQDTVLLKESDGACDYICVVSCLVQLCLDPYYRTLAGFAVLIQKEWLALAHPFGQRLFGFNNSNWSSSAHTNNTDNALNKDATRDSDREMTPVFLLFVDCVYQLVRVYPAEFEFSAVYLISLWDVVLSGLATAFLYNGLQDTEHVKDLCPLWPVDRFYSERHSRLFTSAAYACRKLTALVGREDTQPAAVRKHLYPPEHVVELSFWNELYLRWAAPAHIRDGGDIQSSLLLNGVAVQIMDLLQERAVYEKSGTSNDVLRALSPHIRTYSTDTAGLQNVTTLNSPITSSFPYNNETLSLHEQSQQRLPNGVHLTNSNAASISDSRLSGLSNRLSSANRRMSSSSNDIDVDKLCAYYTQKNTLHNSEQESKQTRPMKRMQSVPEHKSSDVARGQREDGRELRFADAEGRSDGNVQIVQNDNDQYTVTLNRIM